MKRTIPLLALFVTGCITTQLTPEGAKVRVTSNPEAAAEQLQQPSAN